VSASRLEIEWQDREQQEDLIHEVRSPGAAGLAFGPMDTVKQLRGADRGQEARRLVETFEQGFRPRP
jgi:hypothetical protein